MQLRLEWLYQLPKTKRAYTMSSEFMSLQDCLDVLNDLEKTGRLKAAPLIYDQHDTSWSKKELLRYMKQFETEPHEITAYIDGGYEKQSKLAGIGVVIHYKQNHSQWRIRFNDQLELLEDNNEAEFAALYRLLQQLEQMSVYNQEISVHLDSITVCKQAGGEWPCYEENYVRWLDRIDELKAKLRLSIIYHQVDRSANKEADQLATQALKDILIESKIEKA